MKFLLAIPVLLLSVSVLAQTASIDKNKGRFYFQEGELRDVGTITSTRIHLDTFWFENIGYQPIIINNVNSSSTFIATDWQRDPIRPGQKGYISYIIKSSKHNGPFAGELFIASNAINSPGESIYRIYIKGIIGKDGAKGPQKKKQVIKAPKK